MYETKESAIKQAEQQRCDMPILIVSLTKPGSDRTSYNFRFDPTGERAVGDRVETDRPFVCKVVEVIPALPE